MSDRIFKFNKETFLRFVNENFNDVKNHLTGQYLLFCHESTRREQIIDLKSNKIILKKGNVYRFTFEPKNDLSLDNIAYCIPNKKYAKDNINFGDPSQNEVIKKLLPKGLSLIVFKHEKDQDRTEKITILKKEDISESDIERYKNAILEYETNYNQIEKIIFRIDQKEKENKDGNLKKINVLEIEGYKRTNVFSCVVEGAKLEIKRVSTPKLKDNKIFDEVIYTHPFNQLNLESVDESLLWESFFDLYCIFKDASKNANYAAAAQDIQDNIALINGQVVDNNLIRPIVTTAHQAFKYISKAFFGSEVDASGFDNGIYNLKQKCGQYPNLPKLVDCLYAIKDDRNNEAHLQMICSNPKDQIRGCMQFWVMLIYLLRKEVKKTIDIKKDVLDQCKRELYVPCLLQAGLGFIQGDYKKDSNDQYFIRPFENYQMQYGKKSISYRFEHLGRNKLDLKVSKEGTIVEEVSLLPNIDPKQKEASIELMEKMSEQIYELLRRDAIPTEDLKFIKESVDNLHAVAESHSERFERHNRRLASIEQRQNSFEENMIKELEENFQPRINDLYNQYQELGKEVATHGNRISFLTLVVNKFKKNLPFILSSYEDRLTKVEGEIEKKKKRDRISLIVWGILSICVIFTISLFFFYPEEWIYKCDFFYKVSQWEISTRPDKIDIPFKKAKKLEQELIDSMKNRSLISIEKDFLHEGDDPLFSNSTNNLRMKISSLYADAFNNYKDYVEENKGDSLTSVRAYRLAWMMMTRRHPISHNDDDLIDKYSTISAIKNHPAGKGFKILNLIDQNDWEGAKIAFDQWDLPQNDVYYKYVKCLLDIHDISFYKNDPIAIKLFNHNLNILDSISKSDSDAAEFAHLEIAGYYLTGIQDHIGNYIIDKDIIKGINTLKSLVRKSNSNNALIALSGIYKTLGLYVRATDCLALAYCNGYSEYGSDIYRYATRTALSEDSIHKRWPMIESIGVDQASDLNDINYALKKGMYNFANVHIDSLKKQSSRYSRIAMPTKFENLNLSKFRDIESLAEWLRGMPVSPNVHFLAPIDSAQKADAVANYVMAAYLHEIKRYNLSIDDSIKISFDIDSLLKKSSDLGMVEAVVTTAMMRYANDNKDLIAVDTLISKCLDYSDRAKIMRAEYLRIANPDESRNIIHSLTDSLSLYKNLLEIDDLRFKYHINGHTESFDANLKNLGRRLNNAIDISEVYNPGVMYSATNALSLIYDYFNGESKSLSFASFIRSSYPYDLYKNYNDYMFFFEPYTKFYSNDEY